MSGSPLPGLQFSAGYTHANATVTSSNIAEQVGARLTNAPRDAFNVWTRYDFEGGALNGLGIGLGIAYVGDRVGFLPTADVVATTAINEKTDLLNLPSYTVVDLGFYYKASSNLDFTLKASNLFDKRYFESAGATADINVLAGAPRSLTLSARLRF
jgi:iron complex outermembrane receptor protein